MNAKPKKVDDRPHRLDPRVDAYIAKAAPFAQPILEHLRALVHQAVPDVVEEVKWSRPFFTVNGKILGNVSAFKEHASLGIWNADVAADARASRGEEQDKAMGTFGRLTSKRDLPSDRELVAHFEKAAKALREGKSPVTEMRARMKSTGVKAKAPKPPAKAPADLAAALAKSKKAKAGFDALAPGQKREYVDWVEGAKRPETREKRIATTVAQTAEGKVLNWKYAK